MARIRTIKPEFPHSESMGNITRDARLAFILMWTISDDSGRLRGNSRMLASLLFPYDDDAGKKMDGWINELHTQGCITRYKIDIAEYIQINKWLEHQRIDKPTASKIPEFQEGSENIREDSKRPLVRKGREGKGEERNVSKEIGLEEITVDHISDWLARKRMEGKYINHDEYFVIEQFKQYCQANGKKYNNYISALQNAFEWEKCQPKGERNEKFSNNKPKSAHDVFGGAWAKAGGLDTEHG